jgi:hypothetical protein
MKAIESFPNNYNYYAWIAEIYFSIDDESKGDYFLNIALELISADLSLSEETRMELIDEVNQIKH